MNKTIVIYHGGCRDGFCAAWVVNKWFAANSIVNNVLNDGKVEYHPGFYGQEPPDCKDADVIIVDFCYPLDIMDKILTECSSLRWLDHHKTAIPVFDAFSQFMGGATPIKVVFDLQRSGAGIAWDYFFPSQPRPWIVNYVEDRDLWAKKLEKTDEINAYIACLEFDFEVWDRAADETVGWSANAGKIAIMKTEQYVREVCKNAYYRDIKHPDVDFDNFPGENYLNQWKQIPVVNICQVDCSEVLHELCKSNPHIPFSMYWFKRQDGMYQYGMRSIGDFDVSSVAKLFGGGGHRNVAGFQLNYLLKELK